jgi:hypothetical protein
MTEPSEDSPYSLVESHTAQIHADPTLVSRLQENHDPSVTIVPAGFLDDLMSEAIPDDEFNDALQRAKLRSAEVLRQLGVDD